MIGFICTNCCAHLHELCKGKAIDRTYCDCHCKPPKE